MNRTVIARILRVNHGGEYGAIRIYGAQIAVARLRCPHSAPPPSSSDLFRRPIHANLDHMVSAEGIIAVYIMASGKHGTLYIGVTGNLARRAYEHREGLIPGFTKTHGCTRLVYWQSFELMTNAIQREKTMKRWIRDWKTNLIERENPNWDDLYGNWM